MVGEGTLYNVSSWLCISL